MKPSPMIWVQRANTCTSQAYHQQSSWFYNLEESPWFDNSLHFHQDQEMTRWLVFLLGHWGCILLLQQVQQVLISTLISLKVFLLFVIPIVFKWIVASLWLSFCFILSTKLLYTPSTLHLPSFFFISRSSFKSIKKANPELKSMLESVLFLISWRSTS